MCTTMTTYYCPTALIACNHLCDIQKQSSMQRPLILFKLAILNLFTMSYHFFLMETAIKVLAHCFSLSPYLTIAPRTSWCDPLFCDVCSLQNIEENKLAFLCQLSSTVFILPYLSNNKTYEDFSRQGW